MVIFIISQSHAFPQIAGRLFNRNGLGAFAVPDGACAGTLRGSVRWIWRGRRGAPWIFYDARVWCGNVSRDSFQCRCRNDD